MESILLDILLCGGEGRVQTEPKQEGALEKIVLNVQDCLIVLPTEYGKSLIFQLPLSLFG